MVSLPAALYFVIVYLTGLVHLVPGNSTRMSILRPLASWTGFASYQSMLISEGGFFSVLFLTFVAFNCDRSLAIRRIFILGLASFELILMLIPFSSVSPYRWVLLLTYPLAFYATDALTG